MYQTKDDKRNAIIKLAATIFSRLAEDGEGKQAYFDKAESAFTAARAFYKSADTFDYADPVVLED